jgi:hypothetical protein
MNSALASPTNRGKSISFEPHAPKPRRILLADAMGGGLKQVKTESFLGQSPEDVSHRKQQDARQNNRQRHPYQQQHRKVDRDGRTLTSPSPADADRKQAATSVPPPPPTPPPLPELDTICYMRENDPKDHDGQIRRHLLELTNALAKYDTGFHQLLPHLELPQSIQLWIYDLCVLAEQAEEVRFLAMELASRDLFVRSCPDCSPAMRTEKPTIAPFASSSDTRGASGGGSRRGKAHGKQSEVAIRTGEDYLESIGYSNPDEANGFAVIGAISVMLASKLSCSNTRIYIDTIAKHVGSFGHFNSLSKKSKKIGEKVEMVELLRVCELEMLSNTDYNFPPCPFSACRSLLAGAFIDVLCRLEQVESRSPTFLADLKAMEAEAGMFSVFVCT